MSDELICSDCGAKLSPETQGGLCVRCLFTLGLNAEAGTETAATVVPITEKAGDRIGRYKLLQKIGEGGCGVVYMAEQEEPVRRKVALKVIKLGMDTGEVIARFEAERQALAMMDHPNIAKILDGGATDTGRPYFVMELVRGVKITEYCDQHQLPTRERLDLFIKVCQAIQHAHQKGIIHRDIKPSNILVTVNDGQPVPKVIDFGIAKATEGRLTDKTFFTAFQQFMGTPAYMSPEQAEMTSLDIDTRSDIYSLGVLLYELLTGKTPFDAKELLAAGLDALRRTIREQEPMRPSTRLSTLLAADQTEIARRRHTDPPRLTHLLRGDLDCIVLKCLEKDRTRRYEVASGLAADIQRHLNNEPILARRVSVWRRGWCWVRRKPAVAALLVTMVVAATALMALVFDFLYQRREQERVKITLYSRGDELGYVSVTNALHGNLVILQSLRSFHVASRLMDLGELRIFIASQLENYPSVELLAWLPRVNSTSKIEGEQRDSRGQQIQIEIRGLDGQLRSEVLGQSRSNQFPVLCIEPFHSYGALQGVDLGLHPVCASAMNRAVEENRAIAAAPFTLFNRFFNCSLFFPIYSNAMPLSTIAERRQQLAGFAVANLSLSNLVSEVIDASGKGGQHWAGRFRFIDNTKGDKVTLRYQRNTSGSAPLETGQGSLSTAFKFSFAGREWIIDLEH